MSTLHITQLFFSTLRIIFTRNYSNIDILISFGKNIKFILDKPKTLKPKTDNKITNQNWTEIIGLSWIFYEEKM